MIMGRQNGADLFNGTRHRRASDAKMKRKGTLRSRSLSIGKLSSINDWRNGITGRIQLSVKVKPFDEECQRSTSTTLESDGTDDHHPRNVAQDIENTRFPIQPQPNDCNDSGDDDVLRKTAGKTKFCIEIEKCIGLKISSLSSISKLTGRTVNPFVLVRLNGKQIGRTPALQDTRSPVWFDEVYEFPMCDHCDAITFEVWDAVANSGILHELGDFIGKCTVDAKMFMTHGRIEPLDTGDGDRDRDGFQEYTFELKRWHSDGKTSSMLLSPTNCSCPLEIDEHKLIRKRNSPRQTFHVKRPTGVSSSFRTARLKSFLLNRPETELDANKLKIDNPYPFRRRDIRNHQEEEGNEHFYKSTSFKAFSLIMMYMSVGVLGFSFIFERWSVRDSIYFCVVTFSTVGYGDIKPKSDGGKLFSCAFAFLGIGIIGIALGYVGQNLIQAQMLAMQRKSYDDDEDNLQGESPAGIEPKQSPWMNFARAVLLFFLPLTTMLVVGSGIVGYIEGWSWIDSFYWCVMTGTSVGYGDFYPTTNSMIWFSILFIPVSVGVISSALGRIANVFVEHEIQKSNAKLLKREVTLEDLEAMNADGDGEVSPLEFVEHMLLVMNKVDQKLLDELHAQFERLDADGSGGLQQDDLEILTRRKLEECRAKKLLHYKAMRMNQDIHPPKTVSCPQIFPGRTESF